MNIVVTGAKGFVGKNLCVSLSKKENLKLVTLSRESSRADICSALGNADILFHLAGENRPQTEEEFTSGNVELTRNICDFLIENKRSPKIVFSSSIQAAFDNPYGRSKLEAERILASYSARTGAHVSVYRFSNLFGKWSKPNYNTVVATFCHNIARDLPVSISDPARKMQLCYIDDVINALLSELALDTAKQGMRLAEPLLMKEISLGELAALIKSFREESSTLLLPNFNDSFVQKLYATFLSFLPKDQFAYNLLKRSDNRGSLAEFVKSSNSGQIFVSRTHPGITRGGHFHHTKVEKFLVVEGSGVVRFRSIEPSSDQAVIEYPVTGEDYRVISIPPGYTHSIENTGQTTMVTLFWASEIFDPSRPDTTFEPVAPQGQ